MIAQLYSFPGQTEGRSKTFLKYKSIDLSYELSREGNVNHYKRVNHPIPTHENREHHGSFKNKLIISAFN